MISDPTAVFFVLAAVVALALALERRWHLFRSFGAAFVGILLGMILSNTGVLPGRSPAYDFLVGPAVSAGIVLIQQSGRSRFVPEMLTAYDLRKAYEEMKILKNFDQWKMDE